MKQAVSAILITSAMSLVASTPLSAQECTIGPEQLVGVFDHAGGCRGYDKQFAQKFLHIEVSQCEPPPKKGHMTLGRCMADVPALPPSETDRADEVRQLRILVVEMQGEIGQLRAKMDAQYNELTSEIEYLKSVLASSQR